MRQVSASQRSTATPQALLTAAGIADRLDDGCLPLAKDRDAAAFVKACRARRFWDREVQLDADDKN